MNSPLVAYWRRKFGTPAVLLATNTKSSPQLLSPLSSSRIVQQRPFSHSLLLLTILIMMTATTTRHCCTAFVVRPIAVSSNFMRSISGSNRNTSSVVRQTLLRRRQQQQQQYAHNDRRSSAVSLGTSNALHGLMTSSTTLRTFSSFSTSSSFLTNNGNMDHRRHGLGRLPFSYNQKYQFARFGHINKASQSNTNTNDDKKEYEEPKYQKQTTNIKAKHKQCN